MGEQRKREKEKEGDSERDRHRQIKRGAKGQREWGRERKI